MNSLGSDFGYNVNQLFFDVGPQALGPGSYYFAIQVDSTFFDDYLGQGVLGSGAAESHDGGGSWAFGYGEFGLPSVAVALYGTAGVPEPATWAMALVGIGMAGAALRSRARTVAA